MTGRDSGDLDAIVGSNRCGISRRTLLRGVLAVSGAAIAAACGPASAPAAVATSVAPQGSAAGSPKAAPALTGAQEIVFSHIWATPAGAAEGYKTNLQKVVDAFNAKGTQVTVKARVDGNYDEVMQKMQAELAAGNPSALNLTPWAFLTFAESALGITSLEDIAPKAELDTLLRNYKPATVGLVTLKGKTKGLPFALSTPVIYYNNDLLAKAGLKAEDLLKDWDSFAELGPKIKAVTGKPIMGNGTNLDWPAQSLVQNAGGRIIDDSGQPAMDSPEAVAAIKVLADLKRAELFLLATGKESRAAFVGGTLALFMESIAALSGLRASTSGKFDLRTSTYPTYKGRPRKMSTGGSLIACYARDPQQQAAAWQFLKFVGSREAQEIWQQQGYVNSTTYDIPQLPGQEAAYTQLSENGGATRETNWPGSRGAEMSQTWRTYLERIVSGDISAEDGAKQAKAELLRIMKQS